MESHSIESIIPNTYVNGIANHLLASFIFIGIFYCEK